LSWGESGGRERERETEREREKFDGENLTVRERGGRMTERNILERGNINLASTL